MSVLFLHDKIWWEGVLFAIQIKTSAIELLFAYRKHKRRRIHTGSCACITPALPLPHDTQLLQSRHTTQDTRRIRVASLRRCPWRYFIRFLHPSMPLHA